MTNLAINSALAKLRPAAVVYYSPSKIVPAPLPSGPEPIPLMDGKSASDPVVLARMLMALRESVQRAWSYLLANPFATSLLVLDVPMTHGTRVIVNHSFGQPARFAISNPRPLPPNPASLSAMSIYAMNPQPSEIDQTKQIALVPTFASAGNALVDVLLTSYRTAT